MPIELLRRPHTSIQGAPTLDRVDTKIFFAQYFARCMECTYCLDQCCMYGVDVDGENHERILAVANQLEVLTGVARTEWFDERWTEDAEFPGGRVTRTRVRDGRCVFLERLGRGCLLHSLALSQGRDYHELKPLVSALFPLTFDDGLLHPSDEIEDADLICITEGSTLYRGVRDELLFYFGVELVAELDALELAAASWPPVSRPFAL
ncbi:MAG: hypothetical protein CO108_31170 [Deltaproteobacteria bacterium CG_4_9_14_3_um_filter_63_12]|nr:MAG: hypothetical protein CO108_31170 [Deltaproteobacteria bacterium CG_4_9_14_3_um_filter_63_12]